MSLTNAPKDQVTVDAEQTAIVLEYELRDSSYRSHRWPLRALCSGDRFQVTFRDFLRTTLLVKRTSNLLVKRTSKTFLLDIGYYLRNHPT